MSLNKEALEEQKKYIPEDIFENASINNLKDFGLSLDLSTRIMRNRCLWLVRKDNVYISNIHSADLKYKYTFTGLDITEMRALYACMPDKFENDPLEEKKKWLETLLDKLKQMIQQEKNNTLPQKFMRNKCYLSKNIEKTDEKKNTTFNIKFQDFEISKEVEIEKNVNLDINEKNQVSKKLIKNTNKLKGTSTKSLMDELLTKIKKKQ